MKLFNTLICLIPSMMGVAAAAFLCYEGKEWGWFLFASLVMFVVGVAASMPNIKTKGTEAVE